MNIAFRYAARSDVGLIRKSNQDSGYAGPHLLVLADGMGGPAGGDLASSIAVAHLAPLDNDSHPAEQLLSLLRSAVEQAHEELVERSTSAPELAGLGTTCIAMLRTGNKLAMVHIGDSRAYLLRRGTLTQVTTDHSFVQYLIDTGQITPEEAETHPQRSVILRVLGDSPGEVTLDESVREAVAGDRWLLCSDGLHGVVSPETIGEVLHDVVDPGDAAEELVKLALRAGAPDNVTCVVADVVDTDDPEVEPPDTYPQVVGAAAKDRLISNRKAEGAAAKAAELTKNTGVSENPPEDEEEEPKSSGFGKWLGWMIALMIVVGLAGGAVAAYYWTQTKYFVMIDRPLNQVCIYQGIHQQLGNLKLYEKVECDSRIKTEKLGSELRLTLMDTPVTRSSLQAARSYINDVLLPQVERREREDQAANSAINGPGTPSPSSPAPTDSSPTAPTETGDTEGSNP